MIRAVFIVLGSILLMVTDLFIKWFSISGLSDSESIDVIPGVLGFVLHRNGGVIANFPVPLSLVILITVVVLGVTVRWIWRAWQSRQFSIFSTLSLVFFGALSNLIDRVLHGFTTDYILVFERSVLNIADIMIFVGVALLLIMSTSPSPHSK